MLASRIQKDQTQTQNEPKIAQNVNDQCLAKYQDTIRQFIVKMCLNVNNEMTPQSKAGLCGLQNLGNTCFMNSAIQCLSNSKELTDYFLQNKFLNDINPSNPLGSEGQLAAMYSEIVKELWQGSKPSILPSDLKKIIGKLAPQFVGQAQQDAQELLSYLIDGLHEDLNRVIDKPQVTKEQFQKSNFQNKTQIQKDDHVEAELSWLNHLKRNQSIVVELFHGQYKSKLTCPDCQCVSITFDPFDMISLPIPPEPTLVDIYFYYIDNINAGVPPQKISLSLEDSTNVQTIKQQVSLMKKVKQQQLALFLMRENKIVEALDDLKEVQYINKGPNIPFIYDMYPDDYIFVSQRVNVKQQQQILQNIQMQQLEEKKTQKYILLKVNVCQEAKHQYDQLKRVSYPRLVHVDEMSRFSEVHHLVYNLLKSHIKQWLQHSRTLSIVPPQVKPYLRKFALLEQKQKNETNKNGSTPLKSIEIDQEAHQREELLEEYNLLFGRQDDQQQQQQQAQNIIVDVEEEFLPELDLEEPLYEIFLLVHSFQSQISNINNNNNNNNNSNQINPNLNKQTSTPTPSMTLTVQDKNNQQQQLINLQKHHSHGHSHSHHHSNFSNNNLCVLCDNPKCKGCQLPWDDTRTLAELAEPDSHLGGQTLSVEVDVRLRKWVDVQSMRLNNCTEYKPSQQVQDQNLIGGGLQSQSLQAQSSQQSSKVNIFHCLNLFQKKEKLDKENSWHCTNCKEHKLAMKKINIYKAPPLLILHLKRFKTGSMQSQGKQFYTHGSKKIGHMVEYPLELDLSHYVQQSTTESPYELYAVAVHQGHLQSGHYSALCKNHIKNAWFEFNDGKVTPIQEKNVISSGAYMLFYRQKKLDIEIVNKIWKQNKIKLQKLELKELKELKGEAKEKDKDKEKKKEDKKLLNSQQQLQQH